PSALHEPRNIAPVDGDGHADRVRPGQRNVTDEVEPRTLAEHPEGLAADLVEDADRGRRLVQTRSRRVRPVEIEHGADAAVRADDLDLAARGDDLVAKLQQERGGSAVERVHRRQVERQVGAWRTGQAPHALPRGEALPEA